MLKLDVIVRNARLDAITTAIGNAPTFKLRSGAAPLYCSYPDFGVVIATMILPVNWMLPALNGTKSKAGTWQDLYADNSGVAGHFRIYDSGGICRLQGTASSVGGGGDLKLSTVGITAGQYIQVLSFQISEPNT